jgi:hypothetical protein
MGGDIWTADAGRQLYVFTSSESRPRRTWPRSVRALATLTLFCGYRAEQ